MIIGITGGTGSGKTSVCKQLAARGCIIVDADAIYKELTAPGQPLLDVLEMEFGPGVVEEGSLNRRKLADKVFHNQSLVEKLNKITHKAVKDEIDRRTAANAGKVIIWDVPLLFEAGMDKECDQIWTVTAPLEIRIARVMKRDSIGREQVLDRIHHQMSDEERIARSQAVIINDDREHTKQQIDELMERL